MAFYVYILRCADGRYYTGYTDDMERRLTAHKMRTYSGYTSVKLPVELVFVEDCGTRDEAFRKERQIKGWTRAKKEALIAGDWNELPILAHAKNNHQETLRQAQGERVVRPQKVSGCTDRGECNP
ncbi:MAG: GIY-YIG nuclease family protein [Chloroflexi bacterium]|nr:GIY-YIG nuclease family protein [Chloroflexota bacterium]